jgi:hypothetical protein
VREGHAAHLQELQGALKEARTAREQSDAHTEQARGRLLSAERSAQDARREA